MSGKKINYRDHPLYQHVVFGTPSKFFNPFEPVEKLETPLLDPLLAFKENLASAFRVGSVPFLLTHSAVLQQRLHQIQIAETIRAHKDVPEGEDIGEKRRRDVLQISRKRMDEELEDPEIVTHHAKETLTRLDTHLQDSDFFDAASEILRQMLGSIRLTYQRLGFIGYDRQASARM